MGRAVLFAAVSLDGFIADDHDAVGPLFDWYGNGDVPVTFTDEQRVFHTTPATAGFLRSTAPAMAAGVLGRRLFDLQALRLGLIDRVVLNLVPAVLGSGRPFFGVGGMAEPLLFDDPRIVRGRRVTHLVYDARR